MTRTPFQTKNFPTSLLTLTQALLSFSTDLASCHTVRATMSDQSMIVPGKALRSLRKSNLIYLISSLEDRMPKSLPRACMIRISGALSSLAKRFTSGTTRLHKMPRTPIKQSLPNSRGRPNCLASGLTSALLGKFG